MRWHVPLCVAAAMVLMTAQPFATRLTQNPDGGYDYIVLSVTTLCEALKLVFSLGMYALLPADKRSHALLHQRDVLLFALPALLYAMNNYLLFVIVTHIRPAHFQLLSTLKTVFTALLFRAVLKRVLTPTHQAAIVILAAGAAVSRLPDAGSGCEYASGEFESGSGILPIHLSSEWVGVLLTLVSCVFSSLAGVVNEALLKKEGQLHSLFLQNGLLYAWGVAINLLALAVQNHDRLDVYGPFDGYGPGVLLLLLVNALTGLSISAVLKFTDNLVRVFAHTAAMLLTMILESTVLATPPSVQLVLAVFIVSSSAAVYTMQGPPLPMRILPVLLAEIVTEVELVDTTREPPLERQSATGGLQGVGA